MKHYRQANITESEKMMIQKLSDRILKDETIYDIKKMITVLRIIKHRHQVRELQRIRKNTYQNQKGIEEWKETKTKLRLVDRCT